MMHSRLVDFLEMTDIFYVKQYGFRRKRSTIHAILDLVGHVTSAHEEGKLTGAIFLDLSKAFDTLQHNIFYDKLEYYGIRGIALDWIKSYLLKRQHVVSINNTISDTSNIEMGCPQGSIVGPLFYIMFVNCIGNVSQTCSIISFADDTTILYSHNSVSKIREILEIELEKFLEYFRVNQLSVNVNKTYVMLFNLSRHKDEKLELHIKSTGERIKCTENCRFLGVQLDPNLSWNIM